MELLFLPGTVVAPQPRAPAEQAGDARQQDGEVERLGQVVVGARLEAAQHVVGVRAGGQQHHRHELPRRAQPPHHLEAVEAGQHDVEQDDIEPARAGGGPDEALQGHLAVLLHLGGEALRLEVQLEAAGQVLLVFDDEDAARDAVGGSHHAFSGSSRVKVLPRPAPRLSANARPPCRRATARTIDSPSPVPRTRARSAAGSR